MGDMRTDEDCCAVYVCPEPEPVDPCRGFTGHVNPDSCECGLERRRNEDGCEYTMCKEDCGEDKCEPVRCRMACENGYKTDKEGCEICECRDRDDGDKDDEATVKRKCGYLKEEFGDFFKKQYMAKKKG